MENCGIPVFLSADNGYAPFVATTIASICDHTRSFIDFYILDGGITEENKRKIEELKKLFSNFSIEFFDIDANDKFGDFVNCLHYSKTMYARFFIPFLKPELQKVLYSDVDVVFLDDIAKMYQENLHGYIIGAVPESFVSDVGRKRFCAMLGLAEEHQIFASGNLIIDCDKWRQSNITEKLFEINKLRKKDDMWVDQTLLNICFNNDYCILADKYCYTIQHDVCFGKKNVTVCHYNGPVKPWHINPNTETSSMPYLKEFWKYAEMTCFYDELIAKTQNKDFEQQQLCKLQSWRKIVLLKYKNKIL